MSYTITLDVIAGTSRTGLTDLRAQLVNSAGSNAGSAVSTGFTELGGGNYQWTYASMPDAFRGSVKFYSNADTSDILGTVAINPGSEFIDMKLSALPALIWSYVRRTLTAVTGNGGNPSNAEIKIFANTTAEIDLTGLSISASWAKLYFAVKTKPEVDDGSEVLLIVETNPGAGTDGLLIVNGTTGTAEQATMTVDQAAGTIAIVIEDDTMTEIAPRRYCYDLKQLVAGRTKIIASGDVIVQRPVNRRVS